MSTFDVFINGELQANADVEKTVNQFATLFKLDVQQARKLVTAGKRRRLRKSVSTEQAERTRAVLQKMGLGVDVLPHEAPQEQEQAPQLSLEQDQATQLSLEQDEADATAPVSQMKPPRQDRGDADGHREQDLPEVRRVELYSGLQWLSAGFEMFKASPLAWIFASVVATGIDAAISAIPVIGGFLAMAVWPVLFAGLMLGAEKQSEGAEFPGLSFLSGFSARPASLVGIGLVYGVIVSATSFAIVGIAYGLSALTGGEPDGLLFTIIVTVCLVPPIMILFFGPMLVSIDGVSVLEACRLSVSAGFRNFLAFMVYLVGMFLVLLCGALAFGVGILVALPVILASMYAGYRELFE